MATVGVKGLIT